MKEPDKRTLEIVAEWAQSEAPGAERVVELPIPEMPQKMKPRVVFFKGSVAKIIAAAAIFLFGFVIGQVHKGEDDTRRLQPEEISANPAKPADAKKTPEAAPKVRQVAYTQQKDGKLFIETQLKDSGAQAIWVVDGSVKIKN